MIFRISRPANAATGGYVIQHVAVRDNGAEIKNYWEAFRVERGASIAKTFKLNLRDPEAWKHQAAFAKRLPGVQNSQLAVDKALNGQSCDWFWRREVRDGQPHKLVWDATVYYVDDVNTQELPDYWQVGNEPGAAPLPSVKDKTKFGDINKWLLSHGAAHPIAHYLAVTVLGGGRTTLGEYSPR